ncbi:unnamed protein product [Brassica rapa]|uniref:Uncharacterized protein n=2 Tax=Brassica TaxID=3705 RepID=A0A3P5ZWY2_BRACM|nr:unnamed protein product [Brassica napus]CAG7881980.1 unnamed protein product [Brassica rapa]VDC81275.1 unnamed protein product [Brassica rapa]
MPIPRPGTSTQRDKDFGGSNSRALVAQHTTFNESRRDQ